MFFLSDLCKIVGIEHADSIENFISSDVVEKYGNQDLVFVNVNTDTVIFGR